MARVVVVGGGFGGLAAALRLAKLRHEVTLVEPGPLGGALAPVTADGFTWPGSASYTLVPAVVRDLFRKTGRPIERELELEQLDCLREHWFEDGTSLVLTASRTEQQETFDALTPGLGEAWTRYVASYADDWELLRRGFFEVPWVPGSATREVTARLGSRRSLRGRVRRALRDERARLVASYPFDVDGHDLRQVPAWAGLTAYLEQRFGAWAPVGGMPVLLETLLRRLSTRGVTVVTASVDDVVLRAGRAVAVATADGELDADVVVCATDPRRLPALAASVARTLPALPPMTTHVGLTGPVPDLPHELVVHGDPLLVVRCTGAGADGSHAWTVRGRGQVDEDLLDTLARRGLDVRGQVVARVDLSPADLVKRWNGSPLGVLWQGRGTVRSRLGPTTPYAGVYVCGAHANPGSGLPFVGLSAAQVAELIGPT